MRRSRGTIRILLSAASQSRSSLTATPSSSPPPIMVQSPRRDAKPGRFRGHSTNMPGITEAVSTSRLRTYAVVGIAARPHPGPPSGRGPRRPPRRAARSTASGGCSRVGVNGPTAGPARHEVRRLGDLADGRAGAAHTPPGAHYSQILARRQDEALARADIMRRLARAAPRRVRLRSVAVRRRRCRRRMCLAWCAVPGSWRRGLRGWCVPRWF